jgi:hypothetical protein
MRCCQCHRADVLQSLGFRLSVPGMGEQALEEPFVGLPQRSPMPDLADNAPPVSLVTTSLAPPALPAPPSPSSLAMPGGGLAGVALDVADSDMLPEATTGAAVTMPVCADSSGDSEELAGAGDSPDSEFAATSASPTVPDVSAAHCSDCQCVPLICCHSIMILCVA